MQKTKAYLKRLTSYWLAAYRNERYPCSRPEEFSKTGGRLDATKLLRITKLKKSSEAHPQKLNATKPDIGLTRQARTLRSLFPQQPRALLTKSEAQSLEAHSSTQEESQSYEGIFTSVHEVTSSIRRLNSTKSEARELKLYSRRESKLRKHLHLCSRGHKLHPEAQLNEVRSPGAQKAHL